MNHFKGKQFSAGCDYCSRGLLSSFITLAIVKFKKSYMIVALTFSHTTIYRWVQEYGKLPIKFEKEK